MSTGVIEAVLPAEALARTEAGPMVAGVIVEDGAADL